jgi:hypothetical protein
MNWLRFKWYGQCPHFYIGTYYQCVWYRGHKGGHVYHYERKNDEQ